MVPRNLLLVFETTHRKEGHGVFIPQQQDNPYDRPTTKPHRQPCKKPQTAMICFPMLPPPPPPTCHLILPCPPCRHPLYCLCSDCTFPAPKQPRHTFNMSNVVQHHNILGVHPAQPNRIYPVSQASKVMSLHNTKRLISSCNISCRVF